MANQDDNNNQEIEKVEDVEVETRVMTACGWAIPMAWVPSVAGMERTKYC